MPQDTHGAELTVGDEVEVARDEDYVRGQIVNISEEPTGAVIAVQPLSGEGFWVRADEVARVRRHDAVE